LELVPIGVPGELLIGGLGTARGYRGRPKLTAARFVPDPWDPSGGTRLYRSGDLVRFLPGGDLEFFGRIDEQVKVRGFRIEPGEIEALLAEHPSVRDAAVVVCRDPGGSNMLVAYVVPVPAAVAEAGELRRLLREVLPGYMVPAAFVFSEALPRTPSGKVDRSALARARPERVPGRERPFTPPRGPHEEVLAGIWAEVLDMDPATDRVGVHDNFFELGGHSLLATQVVSRVRNALGAELAVRTLFESPTVAELAEQLGKVRGEEPVAQAPPIGPVPREGALPLSFAQQRLWFLDQLRPGSALYTIPLSLRLTGALDRGVPARALSAIVGRHEVLRTTYEAVSGESADGGPVQVIRPACELSLPVLDLAGLSEPRRRLEARRLARAHARQPFDLARGPVLRAALLRLAAGTPEREEHSLLVAVHHIAFDGWSIGVFLDELAAGYQAISAGRAPTDPGLGLPEPAVQYADFAVWQRHWLSGAVLERQLGYWREQLAGLSVLELPTDRPRPAVQSFRGAAESFTLPAAVHQQLAELSRGHGCTLFMTLLAAFQALLRRYTGQADPAVGSPIANRNRAEIEGLLGFFVNTLVLRGDLSGDPSFTRLLARVRDAALEAYAHQDVPFEQLVEALEPERDLSHSPLVQVFFVLQNALTAPRELAPGLGLELEPVDTGEARFDLTLALEEDAGELRGAVQYSIDLFDAATVHRLIGHLRTLLAAAAADPERRLSQLSLLTEAERHALLLEWSHTPYGDLAAGCVHQLFEAQAGKRPDAVAVVSAAGRLSYAELNARANRLAAHLRSLGVGPEVVVGLFLERSLEALVGILGVLKAGGAYLPLDPGYPRERLAFMLEDARVPVVLTRERLAAQLPPLRSGVVRLDADRPTIAALRPADAASAAAPANLAYVIYTSGSTGRPKGVLVAHRGVCAMAEALQRRYEVTASSRVLLWASLSFDASAAEIFTTLPAGATLCLGTSEELVPGPALVELLGAHEVTNLTLVPSALQALPVGELPALRSLVVAGEACLGEVVAPWMRGRHLVNAYGPTEATVCATAARLASSPGPKPAIGRPVASSRVYVLDRFLEPVPAGVPGELAIGGVGLARGYLGRPAATAGSFIPDPWSGEPEPRAGGPRLGGERLYRSGDLVRFLPDGDLEFLGRIDQQVKVRGFRLEPGEVEAALGRHPGVREAVVVVAGRARVVAYVVLQGESAATDALQDFLRLSLPEYMVPSLIVEVEALPLLPSGKVDRGALARATPHMSPSGGTLHLSPSGGTLHLS
ncbi:MAG: amino acid adenylation domain-containing protein, partial [bacterium]|nr:amino acid adenylation domain-containing protein [bacterium]